MTRLAGKWILPAFFLAAAVLFYFENRAAYKGYFSDDDLDNLGWPTAVGNDVFYHGFATSRFDPSHFRPTGFLYYRLMGRAFKLTYPPYVAVLQVLHGLCAIMLFVLLRRLNLSSVAAGAGALFYAFHAVVMEAYWKPMYVFDLLCGTLCLVTLLLYIQGRWILAVPAFWLAYKSKEVAVMLPAVLIAYEWLLGERKWLRLIPFCAISFIFGVQALLYNTHITAQDVYALNFTPQLLWSAISFYTSSILLAPLGGLIVLATPIFVRDRRLYLGLIAMVSLLFPLVALSNRVSNAYWYVPLIGLAIAVAAVASHVPRWAIALFFVLWLPLNYGILRTTRKDILARADEVRWYVAGLQAYASRIPRVKTVIFESTPPHMQPWGIVGAIKQTFGFGVDVVWEHDPGVVNAMQNVPVAIVTYYPAPHIVRGLLRTSTALPSAIDFRDNVLASQLADGWHEADGSPVRRVGPKAEVTLYRSPGSTEFAIECVAPESSRINVLEDGVPLGVQTVSDHKGQTVRWKLPAGSAGNRRITIVSEPVRHEPGDPSEYGIAIRSLGYVAP